MNSLTRVRAVEMTGLQFGRWTVINRDTSKPYKRGDAVKWFCKCDCGSVKSVYGYSLRSGESKSCGCLLKELNKDLAKKRTADLSGQTFGRYTVLHRDLATVKKGNRKPNYICQCKCGSIRSVGRQALTKGESQSCGCLHKEIVGEGKVIDLTGKLFGTLTVIERNFSRNQTSWLCLCECGKQTVVSSAALKSKATQSCGCLQRKAVSKHGLSHLRIYSVWMAMIARCTNPANAAYKNYGGRGITICDEWLNSLSDFVDWALCNGYTDDLTIERINVNGNYEPKNVTFIPFAEQAKNKRRTKR